VEEAVVFDALRTLFELRPLAERLEQVGAPGGTLDAWFERLLHSAAAVTLAGDFARTAAASRHARCSRRPVSPDPSGSNAAGRFRRRSRRGGPTSSVLPSSL